MAPSCLTLNVRCSLFAPLHKGEEHKIKKHKFLASPDSILFLSVFVKLVASRLPHFPVLYVYIVHPSLLLQKSKILHFFGEFSFESAPLILLRTVPTHPKQPKPWENGEEVPAFAL